MTSVLPARRRTPIAILLGICAALTVPPAGAALIINEVDYDQAGTDRSEFVELYNSASRALSLDRYRLEFINGTNGSGYRSFTLAPETLEGGAYWVLCGDPSQVPGCNQDLSPDTNLLQNGAPDALALWLGDVLVDALSYEGTVVGFSETAGNELRDGSAPYLGLSRVPNGFDTDNNQADFALRCISPGASNLDGAHDCPPPQAPRARGTVPLPSTVSLLLIGALAARWRG